MLSIFIEVQGFQDQHMADQIKMLAIHLVFALCLMQT